MKCNEVRERLIDAIDLRLPENLRIDLLSHVDLCKSCRFEYEFQALAKDLVRRKIKRPATPPQVRSLILSSLETSAPQSSPGWLRKFAAGQFARPAFASGLAVILVAILLFVSAPFGDDEFAHTGENDMMVRTVQNFSLVRSGELKPSMIACYPDIVVGYFKQQDVDFAVSVLADDSCDWYGAVSDSYDGVKQAHIVYKRGDDILYVLEVNKQNAQAGSVFSLPAAARKSLAETGWYTDPEHEECNVILWTVNETLCAAVSTMNKDRMLALLSSR